MRLTKCFVCFRLQWLGDLRFLNNVFHVLQQVLEFLLLIVEFLGDLLLVAVR